MCDFEEKEFYLLSMSLMQISTEKLRRLTFIRPSTIFWRMIFFFECLNFLQGESGKSSSNTGKS